MRWQLFFSGFIRALFVLYCVEAGAFLVLVPWREVWQVFAGTMPWPWLQGALLEPLVRGAVSGFGLVHLVWGIHDLEELLTSRRRLREQRQQASL